MQSLTCIKYYNSPIGILKIITKDDYLTNLSFSTIPLSNTYSSRTMKEVTLQLDNYFNGKLTEFNFTKIKLKLDGTEFQKSVWESLLKIQYGHTSTYKNIACEISNPKAVRAVGNANKHNKIAILIPCHRVIGTNKSLTGFAGGLENKQWLLNHEKTIKLLRGSVEN
jgi:methylated-DNA-[protein]-cysteine S-methyltransferase